IRTGVARSGKFASNTASVEKSFIDLSFRALVQPFAHAELSLSLDNAGFAEVCWRLPNANVLACPIGTLRWPIGISSRLHPLARPKDQASPLAGTEPYIAGAG